MRVRNPLAAAILVLAAMPAWGHRLDEYLQGAIVSVGKSRLQVQMTLTPGVAVFHGVIASIDTDSDGVISPAEQRAYAERVLRDLSLTIDGHPLTPQLLSIRFPATDEMKEGTGEIQLDFDAALPRGGRGRKLIFENHHRNRISAYQVNCLVPRDPNIRIVTQKRNYSQSLYELDYVQAGVRSDPLSLTWWAGARGWLGMVALLLFAGFLFRSRQAPKLRTIAGPQEPGVAHPWKPS